QKAVEVLDDRVCVDVLSQQYGVLGFHAAVAADIQIEAALRGDHAEVFALSFGAFAGTARNGAFELVGAPQPFVAILEQDGQADRIADTIAAPRAAHARFDGAQGLAIGVTRLEARVDQLAPNAGELIEPRAEHVDALPAGDLGIKTILFGDSPEGHQLLGGDFAAGNARNHGVGSVALNVGEVAVIRVLQPCMRLFQDVLVPCRGQNGRHRRLADLAAHAAAVACDQLVERLDLFYPHQVIQLLPAELEVFAQVVVDLEPRALQLAVQELPQERHAGTAAGACLGAGLDGPYLAQLFRADRPANGGLVQVVAGANRRLVRQSIDAQPGALGGVARFYDELIGLIGQRQ